MSELSNFVKKHTNTYAICSCGKKCPLSIFIGCGTFIRITAKCYNCNKGLAIMENTALIDYANFDLVDYLIDEFKKRFNGSEEEE